MRLFIPALLLAAAAPSAPLAEVSIAGAPLGLELQTKAGQPFDAASLRRDVRALWASGRYSDVQVLFNEDRNAVHFDLEPAPRYRLRSTLFEPRSEARELDLEAGARIDAATARRMAAELQSELRSRGFQAARVKSELRPVQADQADILFRVDPGRKVRVSRIRLDGPLRKQLRALAPTTVAPRLRLSKAFTQERLAEDVARLRSALLADARFDFSLRHSLQPADPKRLELAFDIEPGPRFAIERSQVTTLDGALRDIPAPAGRLPKDSLCTALHEERAHAEAAGRLDFVARIEVRPLPPAKLSPHRAAISAFVTASEPYRIRWIGFEGAPGIRDATLRKALKLQEGDLLDSGLLRRSIARLNRFSFLEPVSQQSIAVTPAADGQVDLAFRLRQQSPRRWTIGGPLGPMALFGPIHGKLETRLPSWGRGLLELSTYTLGGWLTSVPELVLENDAWVWKTVWQPSLALSRPALPGQPWSTGYLWSPQLSLKQTLAANAAMRFCSHLGDWIAAPPQAPTLRVPVHHVERGYLGDLHCKQHRRWTHYLRTGGKLALAVAGL